LRVLVVEFAERSAVCTRALISRRTGNKDGGGAVLVVLAGLTAGGGVLVGAFVLDAAVAVAIVAMPSRGAPRQRWYAMPSVPMRLVAAHFAACVTAVDAVPVVLRMVLVQSLVIVVHGSAEVREMYSVETVVTVELAVTVGQ
jgi:hypothetical protein